MDFYEIPELLPAPFDENQIAKAIAGPDLFRAVELGTITPQQIELHLADECGAFYNDPLGWVNWAFDWGHGDLEGFDGPDYWQEDILNDLGAQIALNDFNGVDPVLPIREAVASGHGIGKSALVSMLILFIMSTRPHCKGIVTANTGDQLRTKTWSELAKWKKRCIVGHWFELNSGKGSLSMHHKSFAQTWRVDAMTSEENRAEAFAGLHCSNSTPFFIFDEASAIPNIIWEVAEGGLTDGEPMFFAFGNPTRNVGKFKECFKGDSRWHHRSIDSRTCKMPNKKLHEEWIRDYGIDSDFVRVRVRGMFPMADDTQFIPSDVVTDAMKRGPGRYLGNDPLICGIDVARGGPDNCYIVFRRGYDGKSEKVYKIPGEKVRNSMRLVSIIIEVLKRHKPDVTFLDETGMGGPMVDRLVQLGYHVIGVNFGGKADDERYYYNKTAEMGARLKKWLFDGGALPQHAQLEQELTVRGYWHNDKDQLCLDKKDYMKEVLKCSPDWGDALYLTFAHDVPPRQTERGILDAEPYARQRMQEQRRDYDPLDNV